MTKEDAKLGPRQSLEADITDYLDEQYPYWVGDPQRVPQGLVIEMHPNTRLMILRDPTNPRTPAGVFGKLSIPVKITMDLKSGEWRLVHVIRDFKIGGVLS